MWTECQRILINFLLLISHKPAAIDKHCPLPYLLPIFAPRLIYQCYSFYGIHKEEVMIYINMIGVTWLCWWSMQSRGVTWCRWWFIGNIWVTWWQRICVIWWWWWWYLLNSWLQETNNIYGYFFPSNIWKFIQLNSNVLKGVLFGVWIQVNDVDEHKFFGEIRR